jgi:hypothetical protein
MVRLYGRHILLQSYTKHFLRDPLTQDRVSQGRKPLMTGLSTTAFSLAEEEWTLATPASIAQARSEGTSRTRLQEPFAIIPMPHRAFPLHCQSNRVSLDGVSCYRVSQCTHRTRRPPGPFHYLWLVTVSAFKLTNTASQPHGCSHTSVKRGNPSLLSPRQANPVGRSYCK